MQLFLVNDGDLEEKSIMDGCMRVLCEGWAGWLGSMSLWCIGLCFVEEMLGHGELVAG